MDNSLEIILEEMEKILEEMRDEKTEIQELSNEFTEIKRMLRHIHNHLENIKRENYLQWHRFSCLAYVLEDKLGLSKEEIDEIIQVNPDLHVQMDREYSEVDEIDKIEWEKHLEKEKKKMNELIDRINRIAEK